MDFSIPSDFHRQAMTHRPRRLGGWLPAACLLVFGVAAFPPARAGAQIANAPPALQHIWQLLEANNLTLQQFDLTLRQAEKEVQIQKAGRQPTIALLSSYNHISEIARIELPFTFPGQGASTINAGVKDQYDVAVQLRLPLFTGYRRRYLVRSAQSQQALQEIEKYLKRQQLYLSAGELYFALQLTLLREQVLRQALSRAESQLFSVRSLVQAQQATGLDTLEIINRKLQVSIQLEALQNILRIQRSRLAFLLGVERLPDFPRLEVSEMALDLGPLESQQQLAMRRRQEMPQMNGLLKLQDQRLKVLRAVRYPQLFANAAYHYARPGTNFFRNEWMNYYTIGLNLSYQLWNGRQDALAAQQVRDEAEKLTLALANVQRQIRQEVEEAYLNLENARRQIELQKNSVALAVERSRMVQERFAHGLATSIEESQIENSRIEAELLLQEKYIDALAAQLRLLSATGVLAGR